MGGVVICAFPLRNIDPMRLITAFAGQARLIFALAVMSDIGILRAAEHRGVFRVAVNNRSVLPLPEFAEWSCGTIMPLAEPMWCFPKLDITGDINS